MKASNDLPRVNRVHSASGAIHLLYTTAITLLWLIVVNVSAQDRTITGTVTTAEDVLALPGVNIMVKGTTRGTTTDADGKYSLSVPTTSKTLIFSYVGFEVVEEEIGERSVVNVKMVIADLELGEIVVTALGLKADRDKVGSATTQINGNQITKSGEPTLINGMSGKSSGLIVSRTTGDPGSGSYIQIRGQSSITSSVQPLIVVDGVPVYNSTLGWGPPTGQQSRINDINPNDIEFIDVLKGASASALWGTRAANGVIMITTKKGSSKTSKVNISYSGTYSVDKILVKHPLQNKWGQGNKGIYTPGYIYSFGDKIADRPGGEDSVYTNQGYFKTLDGREIYPVVGGSLTDANGGKNSTDILDPYDAIYQTGHYYDQTLTLSGGNADGNFYISIGDLNQQGIVKNNSNYRRTSFRVNTEKQMTNWLKLGSNFMYSRVTSDRITQASNVNAVMVGTLRTPPDWNNAWGYEGYYYDNTIPTQPIKINPNRQLSFRNPIGKNIDPAYDNPVWSMNNDRSRTELDRFMGSMQLDISPFEWLTATLRGGIDHYSDKRSAWAPPGTAGGAGGGLTLQTARETQFNFDGFLKGRFKVGGSLKISSLLGVNFNQRSLDNIGGFISNLIITTNPPFSLDNTLAANDDPFNSFSQQRSAATYATVGAEFKNYLFLDMTGRAENSSVFNHANNPTFFYPSATINWHLLKTLGIENKILSFTKLRAGYGVVSTIPGPYNTATYWMPSLYLDAWGPVVRTNSNLFGGGYELDSRLGNKNLKPETKTEWEIGFDTRLIRDRISLGATYFSNNVKDLIIPVPMAGSTGFTNQTANVAELQNKGIEIDFSGEVLKPGPVSLKIFGNWTRIRNKVTDLAGSERISLAGGIPSAVPGYPVSIFYGSVWERDDSDSLVLDGNGFPRLASTNAVIGDPNPDWRSALGFNVSWKGLGLNVLFEHSHGGNMHSFTRGALITHGTHKETDSEVTLSATDAAIIENYSGNTVASYGYVPNPDGSYTVRGYLHDFGGGPVLIDQAWWTSVGGGFGAGTHQAWVESAQWTKLREVSLSYSLQGEKLRKASKLSSVDFSITGRNLFLWTDFIGNDPETSIGGPINARGIESFNNPATKSFLFTIKINY